jgi:hypothetical protein
MRKMLCWIFGHEFMNTSARHRICVRCEARETLRNLGDVVAWEEAPKAGS